MWGAGEGRGASQFRGTGGREGGGRNFGGGRGKGAVFGWGGPHFFLGEGRSRAQFFLREWKEGGDGRIFFKGERAFF